MEYHPETHNKSSCPDASGNTSAGAAARSILTHLPQSRGRWGATNKRLQLILPGTVLLTSLPLLALANGGPRQTKGASSTKSVQAPNPDRGQQAFEQNCSRCHNPPQGFSPHISGTIAMHMRVRANLSNEDYRALRRFLNP